MNQSRALSPINQLFGTALVCVQSALQHLNDMGVDVVAIEIRGPRPVLVIEAPRGDFLRGATRKRMTINGAHRATMVASMRGCLVEWVETTAFTREASSR